MFKLSLVALLMAAQAAVITAAPSNHRLTDCSLADAKPDLPANQTQLVQPSGAPKYVALGVGVQNYTCGAAGTYSLFGALADLYDVSCIVDTPLYKSAPQLVYDIWVEGPIDTAAALIEAWGSAPPVLGQHYYVPTPNATTTSYSPKWDFTSSGANKGNPEAYVIGKKVGDILSPLGNSTNGGAIDWLSISGIEGKLASQILRIDTVGGIQPASCTPGSPQLSVKYTAAYWFYGSSL